MFVGVLWRVDNPKANQNIVFVPWLETEEAKIGWRGKLKGLLVEHWRQNLAPVAGKPNIIPLIYGGG